MSYSFPSKHTSLAVAVPPAQPAAAPRGATVSGSSGWFARAFGGPSVVMLLGLLSEQTAPSHCRNQARLALAIVFPSSVCVEKQPALGTPSLLRSA